MKKLLLQIAFLLLIIPAYSQLFVSVSGTVTDTATGLPIPNHAVTIMSDSTGGFVYYNVEYTNAQGFYNDTIIVPGGATGTMFIQTLDCNNLLHQDVWTYTPNQSHTSNFSICNSNGGGCQAYFMSYPNPNGLVQFTDMSTGNINSWAWNFGDPASGSTNISTVQNPTHIYSSPGTYTACLTVHGADSTCNDTYCQVLVIGTSAGCQAAFTYYVDTLNALNTVHFNDLSTTTSGVITTWTWNFGDGSLQTISFPGNPNVIHTYLAGGTYSVCLSIQGSDSCYDQTCQLVMVGFPTGCVANFTWVDSTNTGNPIQFTDLSQASGGGPITSWSWDFGDPASGVNNFSSAQNPVHTFSASGTYNVCLTIHGADSSCYDMTCKSVIVGNTPGCQANFTYATYPATGIHNVTFTDLSTGNPTSWMWSFGDGTASTVQNPVHLYAAAGTYPVCLTITGITNGVYCTSTFCQNVVVEDSTTFNQVYGQVFAGNFPISAGLVMIFSLDTNANFQPYVDMYPIDSNGVYYFTTVPDGNYYILAIPFDSNGYLPTYYGNTINWQAATLISLGTPNNPYDINLVPSDQMTPGPGSASGQINTGDVSSALMDKINMILKNAQGQAIGFTRVAPTGAFDFSTLAYGTYYLHPEMPGVTSDDIMIVITADKPHVDVVMTFSGKNILGIHDNDAIATQWSIYPNPVTDNLTVSISLKQGTKAGVSIWNMTGEMVANTQVTLNEGANTFGVFTASLPSGIYSLRIQSASGLTLFTKLVKTR